MPRIKGLVFKRQTESGWNPKPNCSFATAILPDSAISLIDRITSFHAFAGKPGWLRVWSGPGSRVRHNGWVSGAFSVRNAVTRVAGDAHVRYYFHSRVFHWRVSGHREKCGYSLYSADEPTTEIDRAHTVGWRRLRSKLAPLLGDTKDENFVACTPQWLSIDAQERPARYTRFSRPTIILAFSSMIRYSKI